MEKINVKRLELLETLGRNLELHKKVYAEAMVGFKVKYLKAVAKLRNNGQQDKFDLYIQMEVPQNHSNEYKEAIEMVRRDCRDVVVISSDDFRKYVLNKWDWMRTFKHTYLSNVAVGYTGFAGYQGYSGVSGYSGTSSEAVSYFGDEDDE